MAIPKTLFGTVRQVPERGEKKWSAEGTGILVSLIDGVEGSVANSGSSFFPVDTVATTLLAAGAILTPTAGLHRVAGASAPVTLDSTTPIAAGVKAGQGLTLMGTSAANTVTILASGNTILNGLVVLGLGDLIELVWDAVLAKWVEKGRNS